ncbi:MOSC domain-containing protein [Croceitalea sp. MTPC5]|nr:MOSC domain-containing protein [Croceitalea sp. MTPC5]
MMKVIATNIGRPTNVKWNGKIIQTGIYKYPTVTPLFLKKEDVVNDTVIDRKHHGGEYKACYLFAADNYPYWKGKYPNLQWNWGMFGENLTVQGLDEANIRIGSIYKIGTALVQITQPREPCFKLGIRFGTQNILKEFIAHAHPGTYIKILEEGTVKKTDSLVLVEASDNALTVKAFYELLYSKEKNKAILDLALSNDALPLSKRKKLQKFL